MSAAEERAETAAASWGQSQPVLVVAEPIRAGEPLTGRLELVERPLAMIPSGAVTEVTESMYAAVDLVPGEIVLGGRALGTDDAVLPSGTLAVAIELSSPARHVGSGDLVDVWASDQPGIGAVERVLHSVLVIDVDDRIVTVAVDEIDVVKVARTSDRDLMVARRG